MRGFKIFLGGAALAALPLLASCSEQQVAAELRSLSGSEDVVFLCRDADGNGHPLSECPDRDTTDDGINRNYLSLYALVSQTLTDEVAVVDITAGHVVDVDPSTPGYGFLRVGGRPVAMAATPDGSATFVATADVGRNGLFALRTTQLSAPETDGVSRDLTQSPACRLSETPGEIIVIPSASAGNCNSPGDKLLVSFPDSGALRVYDAAQILSNAPSTFPDCEEVGSLSLSGSVPSGFAQQLPPDLVPPDTCAETPPPTATKPLASPPRPAGFAVSGNRLYIADQAVPVIHVVDTSEACGLAELSPLLPLSLREPDRVVTTRKVAVSPVTPDGKQYVYAIDSEDQPSASVMAFDVSVDSTDATPIVRPGSPELPAEKPDRIAFGGVAARDVAFAYRDIPYVNTNTGTAEFGLRCDPDPAVTDGKLPEVLARPNVDLTTGARPGLLRGLFGFVLLTNGQIAIVDVDDFDAKCRRPVSANTSSTPDFRGCSNDPEVEDGTFAVVTKDGGKIVSSVPTVTGELSCRAVQPHRLRNSAVTQNTGASGTRAPSLRGFPQLLVPPSATTTAVEDRPRLLAVPFATGDAGYAGDTYVATTRYSYAAPNATPLPSDPLPTDPNDVRSTQLSALNSVILPPLEPRSYALDDTVTVTYEGASTADFDSGILGADASELRDAANSFCNLGAYDVAAMTDYAERDLGLPGDEAATFGASHADFVQIITPLPAEDDSYWQSAPISRERCVSLFGEADAETMLRSRDLSIVEAFADKLTLELREPGDATAADLKACFPTVQKYRLRAGKHWVVRHSASGFHHDVVASGADGRCIRSCNPLKKWEKGRVFEISSTTCRAPAKPGMAMASDVDPLTQRVGCAAKGEVACVYDQGPPLPQGSNADTAVLPGRKAAECIFSGLNERFALYRGRAESVRDSVFTWQVAGGFAPLTMSLSSVSTSVTPQSIQFLPEPEQMAVVDGSSLGLSLFSLDTFGIVKPSPFN